MQRLRGFPYIAYDTNCLVYYCFEVDIPETNPKLTVRGRLTPQARAVTEFLKSNQQKVTTTQAAYDELKECIFNAVDDRMGDREVESMLGLPQGKKVPDQLKLRVQQAVERHVTKLERKGWFVLDREFCPDLSTLQRLQRFFDGQDAHRFGRSKKPKTVDMELVAFGLARQFPLVTNDRGISNFASELASSGLSYKIHNLMDLVP